MHILYWKIIHYLVLYSGTNILKNAISKCPTAEGDELLHVSDQYVKPQIT